MAITAAPPTRIAVSSRSKAASDRTKVWGIGEPIRTAGSRNATPEIAAEI